MNFVLLSASIWSEIKIQGAFTVTWTEVTSKFDLIFVLATFPIPIFPSPKHRVPDFEPSWLDVVATRNNSAAARSIYLRDATLPPSTIIIILDPWPFLLSPFNGFGIVKPQSCMWCDVLSTIADPSRAISLHRWGMTFSAWIKKGIERIPTPDLSTEEHGWRPTVDFILLSITPSGQPRSNSSAPTGGWGWNISAIGVRRRWKMKYGICSM